VRILFVSNYYPPYERGGYEQLCRDVAAALRVRGHDVHVITSDCGVSTSRVEAGIYRVLRTEVDWRPYLGTIGYFLGRDRRERETVARFRRVLEGVRPDILFVWGMYNLPRALLAVAENWGAVEVVYYLCDYWPALPEAYVLHWQEPALHPVLSPAKQWLGKLASPESRGYRPRLDHAVCVSEAVRQRLREAGWPLERAPVIHNGIDPAPFLGRARTWNRRQPSAPLEALYAGRVSPEKGIETAIDALARVRDLGLPAHLSIVGRGPRGYVAGLKATVRRRGLKAAVAFRNWVARDEMPGLLAGCDALICPSVWAEPLPRSLQEAMASCKVAVASRVGGIAELIRDDENGMLFPAGDAGALARQLERLIRDPDLGSRLALAGMQTIIDGFTIARMVDEVEGYLLKLAEVRQAICTKAASRLAAT
jgi:glycosyltransferase involved in cell wall biosynthesis